MLELHARAVGRLGDEAHLDLAGAVEIGLDLPLQVDVPAEHDALGRLVGQHARPAALAAVADDVVDVAADPRLEHHRGERGALREQVVVGIPPGADLVGEDLERPRLRDVDDDRRRDGGLGGCAHESSSWFGGRLEVGQGSGPELVEVGAQHAQPLLIDGVDATRAGGTVGDEPGVLEHLEVLGDGGAADRQLAGQLADRARALGDPLEDRAAGRIGERGEPVALVSRHER